MRPTTQEEGGLVGLSGKPSDDTVHHMVRRQRIFQDRPQRVDMTVEVPLAVRMIGTVDEWIVPTLRVRPELGSGIEPHQLTGKPQGTFVAREYGPGRESPGNVPLMIEQRAFFAELLVRGFDRVLPSVVCVAGA